MIVHAGRALGFKIRRVACSAQDLANLKLPCLILVRVPSDTVNDGAGQEAARDSTGETKTGQRQAIVAQADPKTVVLFEAGSNTPRSIDVEERSKQHCAIAYLLAPAGQAVKDPDGVAAGRSAFGFRWFIPELLKHRRVWRDVLIASLVIQLLALGTPLFTQVVIDKVVVHRTLSTLIVIGIGLAVFMVFTAILSWVRQYLVLHTGNRVDAVLGAAVFEHLFKLPPRYFEHRPTGVIAARMRAVETIREFIASAAVTLVLDLPFLLIFVGMMFYYNVMLTIVALAVIGVIVALSLAVAPIFRERLNIGRNWRARRSAEKKLSI
jgi:subfamily B ATP-binding cassette protein HlyB/CyaB